MPTATTEPVVRWRVFFWCDHDRHWKGVLVDGEQAVAWYQGHLDEAVARSAVYRLALAYCGRKELVEWVQESQE